MRLRTFTEFPQIFPHLLYPLPLDPPHPPQLSAVVPSVAVDVPHAECRGSNTCLKSNTVNQTRSAQVTS